MNSNTRYCCSRNLSNLILFTGFSVTLLLTFIINQRERRQDEKEFSTICKDLNLRIGTQLRGYEQMLRATSGFIQANDSVSNQSWAEYVHHSGVQKYLPGMKALGYSSVSQVHSRTKHSFISHIEPFDEKTQKVIGFDMLSNRICRSAMEIARDSNMAALSEKIAFFREDLNALQNCVLLFVPVYRHGMLRKTVQQREEALCGWVFSVFAMNDFIHDILGQEFSTNHGIELAVYDKSLSADNLLFESPRTTIENKLSIEQIINLPLNFNGRAWLLNFSVENWLVTAIDLIVLISGTIITLLLFFLYKSLISINKNARQIAEELTKDLKESEEKYRTVVETLPNLLTILDKNHEIIFISSNCESFTGFKPDEMPSKEIWWVHDDDRKYVSHFLNESFILETQVRNFEYKAFKKDNQIWYAHSSWEILRDSTGNFNGIVMQTVDFTEIKMAENALIESESQLKQLNTTKDKLFSIIAHDLRSPFSSILGFAELIEENLLKNNNEKALKLTRLVNAHAGQTLIMLENLLEWAKTQTGAISNKSEHYLLTPVFERITHIMNSSALVKDISLNIKLSSDNIYVLADLNMLEVILRNLISNAIKFTHPNGTVDLIAYFEDGEIVISIADNGIGIEAEMLERIFTIDSGVIRNGTSQEKGSGLGLVLCSELVRRLGGNLTVESTQGKGSKFSFRLPGHCLHYN